MPYADPDPSAVRVLGSRAAYDQVVRALREEGTTTADLGRYHDVLRAQGDGDAASARALAAGIGRDELREGVLTSLAVGR